MFLVLARGLCASLKFKVLIKGKWAGWEKSHHRLNQKPQDSCKVKPSLLLLMSL